MFRGYVRPWVGFERMASEIEILDGPAADAPRSWTDVLVLIYVLGNLIVVGGDVALAHAPALSRDAAAWWPVYASGVFLAGTVAVVGPWAVRRRVGELTGWQRVLLRALFMLAIAIGIYGGLRHFSSQALVGFRLERFIFSAPVVAPFIYAGLGGLGLVFLDVGASGLRRRLYWWAATGALASNAALVLVDHAQNGFFHPMELLALAVAVMPIPVAAWCALRANRAPLLGVAALTAVLLIFVGFLGAGLHLHALEQAFGYDWLRWVDGPPPFAPGLFVDFGALVLLLVWKERRSSTV